MSSRVYRLRREALDWVDLGDEVMVRDGVAERYVSMNPSGSMLWKALLEGATEAQLCALLTDAYDVDASVAATDVREFVAELERRQVLEPPAG